MKPVERKLCKVLRNVGVRKAYIRKASTIDDLFLDDLDQKLLYYYFENEFNVTLKKRDIVKLTTLPAVNVYLSQRRK